MTPTGLSASRCAVAGCEAAVGHGGLCHAHYRRVLATGEPGPAVVNRRNRGAKPGCAASECDRPVGTRGLCSAHAHRVARNGTQADLSPIRPYRRYEPGATCAADDCDRAPHSAGFCKQHYDQRRRTSR